MTHGMTLRALLDGIPALDAIPDCLVSDLSLDSRVIEPGMGFVALQGSSAHGIAFAERAIARGAVCVLVEAPVEVPVAIQSRCIRINGLRNQLGLIAARLHGDAQSHLRIIGVTGTNGKTSSVQLLAQAFDALGQRSASIGTLGCGLHGALHAGARTTPDVLSLHRTMTDLHQQGAKVLAMEVSSHALDQQRVAGLHFDAAIFTNLTRDHLDYHGDMDAYGAAKAKLFDWPGLNVAVINIDDAFGRALATRVRARGDVRLITTGVQSNDAEVRAQHVHADATGLNFDLISPWGHGPARSALLGSFNVANVLGVIAVLGAFGVSFDAIQSLLPQLHSVHGRMNRLGGDARLPLVVVDYAHTPDGLEQALKSLREHTQGTLVCVFGCGGDRDKGKRPLMGAIAERLADRILITDDNPRSESGDAIVADIVAGLQAPARARVERDRARAIRLAIGSSRAGDTVLIAGKGHEDYQEVNGVQHRFDDLEQARLALAEAA